MRSILTHTYRIRAITIYKFGRSVYKVRTHFNLECTETLADVVDRLILQDLNDTDN